MKRLRWEVRSGVTLIELLIVVAIVGIISAFLFVGLSAAIQSTRNAILVREVAEVSAALEKYKDKHGVYPSDHQFFDTELYVFARKAYPRARPESVHAFLAALADRNGAQTGQPKKISQTEALVLYLRFMSKDPRDPYKYATIMGNDLFDPDHYQPSYINFPPEELDILYDFPPGSLVDRDFDGFPEFSQKYAGGAPLVYHDARTYHRPQAVNNELPIARWPNILEETGESNGPNLHFASAYAATFDEANQRFTFINPKSYQLICAGLDGDFGVEGMEILPGVPRVCYPVFTKEEPYRFPRLPIEEADNITNFTDGKTFRAFFMQ
jgi:prepilin-type N-terminal cleavage/methylation domain-containing protein